MFMFSKVRVAPISLPTNATHNRFVRILNVLLARKNFFDVFGLSPSYDVSTEQLTSKYRDLLKKSHPDKFHQKSAEEKEESEEQSRLVNEAYRSLLDPLKRGMHLLDVKNYPPLQEGQLDVSSNLLMEIYETNDELADIESSDRLQEIKKQNDDTLAGLIAKTSAAFKDNRIEEAKTLLSQMKYYVTIEERIRHVELKMGIVR